MTFETSDSVEIFNDDGDGWRVVTSSGIPELSRFAVAVVPANITVSCDCVPVPKLSKCYFVDRSDKSAQKGSK